MPPPREGGWAKQQSSEGRLGGIYTNGQQGLLLPESYSIQGTWVGSGHTGKGILASEVLIPKLPAS